MSNQAFRFTGIRCAKIAGKYSKERKKKLSAEQIKEIQNRMNERKTNATALAKEFRISRGLLYQVLKA